MDLSKTNFDINLDLHDELIPWLSRVPSALHHVPSWMQGQAEQSSFINSIHPLLYDKPFVCPCGKSYTTATNLARHKQTHRYLLLNAHITYM